MRLTTTIDPRECVISGTEVVSNRLPLYFTQPVVPSFSAAVGKRSRSFWLPDSLAIALRHWFITVFLIQASVAELQEAISYCRELGSRYQQLTKGF